MIKARLFNQRSIAKLLLALSLTLLALSALSAPKPKILALAPHIVETLYDIGAGEQIIGTLDHADYPASAKDIPRVGNYARIKLEQVIALQPDLIIAWQSGNPSDDLARLKELGFTIVYSQPTSFADIADDMRRFGKLTGNQQQAIEQAKRFEQKLAAIKKQYQDKPLINTFYELWSRPLTTAAKNSWPQQHLAICQANNVFFESASPYPQIDIEQVLNRDVKVIIQPLSANQSDRQAFDWQHWQLIPAVSQQQIIQPNADAMHRMTLRSLIALENLCEQIDASRRFYQALKNDG